MREYGSSSALRIAGERCSLPFRHDLKRNTDTTSFLRNSTSRHFFWAQFFIPPGSPPNTRAHVKIPQIAADRSRASVAGALLALGLQLGERRVLRVRSWLLVCSSARGVLLPLHDETKDEALFHG